ncbi:transposase [Holospora obtusa F1]|uniref:Transposase n=1 Tax=Holospora obtusa F1 TaxID=1399147 RepID=W6TET8_HOLOB|nr:DDE-type integrase/transposase/recombinase [Holospora obtusa]ETZ07421.1 transposase [Holospora obtusa F1]
MGSILHGNAKTTLRVRKEIQNSMESAAEIAKRLGLNIKTVLKWKKADCIEDKRSGPAQPKSVLSATEQEIVCEFRRVSKLPLDDVYIALKEKIPNLTRSNLHRCLKRNGLNVLPKEEESASEKKKFKEYPLGFVHIDITEVRTDQGKSYLFVAIDRATKYVYVEMHSKMSVNESSAFLKNLIAHCPFKITKIFTNNGAQFIYELLAQHLRSKNKTHPFNVMCKEHNIEHRLTKFKHPWINGQVEVTNRILKHYTTKAYFYKNLDELKCHMMTFVLYYNHQIKLKSLKYQTPFDIIMLEFERNTSNFNHNPNHMLLGLNREKK